MAAATSARGKKTNYAKARPAAATAVSSSVDAPDTQASEGFPESPAQVSATPAQAADLLKHLCSTAAIGAQDYNAKVLEFAQANTVSAVHFARQLSALASPLEFMKLSTEYSRKQFEVLTAQTKALASIAQKLTHETTEPLKAGFAKDPNQAA